MTAFRKMSKIRGFKDINHDVKHKFRFQGLDADGTPIYGDNPLPTIPFVGQVKLHGTNGSIMRLGTGHKHGQKSAGDWVFQSKEREVSIGSDNMGFAAAMTALAQTSELETFYLSVLRDTFPEESVVSQEFERHTHILYGEWCGQGIQAGVGITQLPKMFVVFTVARVHAETNEMGERVVEFFDPVLDRSRFTEEVSRETGLWVATDFPTFHIEIDFNNPAPAVERLDALTDEVDKKCPVAAHFGVEGIGEGIVWKPAVTEVDGVDLNNSGFWFKVKGDKHQHTKNKGSKGTEIDFEKLASVAEFVEATVTDVRLNQAWDHLVTNGFPLAKASTGEFVKWMVNDILVEEVGMLRESGIEPGEVKGPIGKAASSWFFRRLNQEL
jgi:hypothetical protein